MREIQSFYADFSICLKLRATLTARPPAWLRRAPKVNRLLPKQKSTHFSQNLSLRFRCVTSLTSLVTSPIWDFYCDISEWYVRSVRAWTPALMSHLTNPCAKRKVLSLTKPKGIYIKRNPSAIILHKSDFTAVIDSTPRLWIFSNKEKNGHGNFSRNIL